MATYGALAAISLFGFSSALAQSIDGQEPKSRTAVDGDKPEPWLFPVQSLNHVLPRWIQFGGEYRSRIESEDGIRYTTTNDTYLLSRFRFNIKIQPTNWLSFFGETQDSHVFFNQHVPEALPYQNSWDTRQAYVQLGNSTEGMDRRLIAFLERRREG